MWNQYTYRVFLSGLGRGFGGEGPRAEGVGGGKPPPNRWSDTPDRGSADFMLNLAHLGLPFGALWLTSFRSRFFEGFFFIFTSFLDIF